MPYDSGDLAVKVGECRVSASPSPPQASAAGPRRQLGPVASTYTNSGPRNPGKRILQDPSRASDNRSSVFFIVRSFPGYLRVSETVADRRSLFGASVA